MRKFLLLAAVGFLALPALADDRMPPITNELVKKECGSCHMAFQPLLLPQRSWRALMDNLSNHFGESAVIVNEGDRREILGYMTGGAADVALSRGGVKMMRGVKDSETPLRITGLPRWKRKHTGNGDDDDNEDDDHDDDHDKRPKKNGTIKKADCVACHPGANNGDYDDD